MTFVNILYQHGRREARRLVLEDHLSGMVGFLLMELGARIEEKEVWYVFILRESFPVGVTS